MPVASVQILDLDVRYKQGLLTKPLALKPQTENLPDCAAATIAPCQEVRMNFFTGRQRGIHSLFLLRERDEFLAEFNPMTECIQTVAQDTFRPRLRHHPEVRIGHADGRLTGRAK
jgi:hypothetical protein